MLYINISIPTEYQDQIHWKDLLSNSLYPQIYMIYRTVQEELKKVLNKKTLITPDKKKIDLTELYKDLDLWYSQRDKKVIIGYKNPELDKIFKWLEYGSSVSSPYYIFKKIKQKYNY
jgi:hypothetical protein